jgi:hypothetical protein
MDDIFETIVARFPAPERTAARLFLIDWINRSVMGSRAVLNQLSDQMSMTNVAHAGNKAERDKRRALIVLEALRDVAVPIAKQTAATMASGALDARINLLVGKLRLEVSATHGDGSVLRDVFLNDLKATPLHFLQNNRVLSGAIGAGTECYFFYEYKKDQFKIDPTRPGPMVNAYKFTTVSIPAVPWNNVPGRGANKTAGSFAAIDGTLLTGADVGISTMFSGCCFCFKVSGGQLYAAHIMPDDLAGNALSGATLAQQIGGAGAPVVAGNFTGTGGGGLRVYGAGWSNLPAPNNNGYPVRVVIDQFMNIFASRIGGNWQIFSQQINGLNVVVNQLYP